MRIYKLPSADGNEYESEKPGTLGGNSKLKVYRRLDCGTQVSGTLTLLNNTIAGSPSSEYAEY